MIDYTNRHTYHLKSYVVLKCDYHFDLSFIFLISKFWYIRTAVDAIYRTKMCLVCAGCKVLSTLRAYCTGFMPNITVIIAPKKVLTSNSSSSTSDISMHRSIPEIYVPNDKYNEEKPIRRKSHGNSESFRDVLEEKKI